jgi:PGF-pre-PGF domain-containing protein
LKKIILILILLFSLLSVSASVDAKQTPNSHSFYNDHELDNGYDNYLNQKSTVTANFQASPLSGVAPLSVQFTDTSTGSPTSWLWNFGDGTTSNSQNPSHTYYGVGTYTVSLTVTDVVGSTATKSNYITVTSVTPTILPVAAFSASAVSGNAPLTVTFTDTSTGSPTSWIWDFGDGTTYNIQNPPHIYTQAGNYTVKLTVSNAFGTNTLESKSLIKVSSTAAVVTDFNTNVTSGKAPLTVQFNDLSTGSPTAWEWDFNSDGQVDSNEKNPVYQFKDTGAYTVTLRTGSSTNTKTNYITVGNGLQASFTVSPGQGVAPLIVQFTDTSLGTPTAWLWDFGDGSTSTFQYPAHIYAQAGNYTVKLTVSNNIDSNTLETPSSVNVSSGIAPVVDIPVVDFYTNLTSGKAPLIVQFNDTSTGNPAAWEWDFNSDGQVDSNEKNPVYEFKDPGYYNVTLRAGNGTAWGNITKTNYITVGGGFLAGFTASPVEGSAPLIVQFTDNSTGAPTAWLWDFGDGNTSIEQNPIHTYSGAGSYSVTLNASNMYVYSVVSWPGYITVTDGNGSSTSGSGGSGSSGTGSLSGGGASPEPASNVEVKLMTQRFIAAGNHIKFEFTKNATCIDFVEFDAKKTLGKTTTILEQLKGKSVLTPVEPGGTVYKYLNIWVGNKGIATPGNIENATVGFRVSKVTVNKTEESTVIMHRYSQGKWNALNTTKTGEDDQYIYYEAKTPGFSPFAITSGKIETIEGNISQPAPQNSGPSIESNQSGKSGATVGAGLTFGNSDWSKYSGAIRFLVVLMVVLFIGLAVREKGK